MTTSTLIPLLIRRECLELDRLVDLCINRYHRRDEFARQGEEDILSDSLAMCIHSFYTGIERIFKAIIREVDGVNSSGPEWHRNLLSAMSMECPGVRPEVWMITERSDIYSEISIHTELSQKEFLN
jgi:hypothetical protein